MIEISVKIKTEDTTITEKFLCYETVTFSHEDPALSRMVADTMHKFKGELVEPDIIIKAKYTW